MYIYNTSNVTFDGVTAVYLSIEAIDIKRGQECALEANKIKPTKYYYTNSTILCPVAYCNKNKVHTFSFLTLFFISNYFVCVCV